MTKKMPALFAKHPPKSEFNTLDDIVDDWIYRFGKGGVSEQMRDEVEGYCAEAPDFETAAQRACASLRPNGKKHNHQSRVPNSVLDFFFFRIRKESEMFESLQSFDELHDGLKSIAPFGIGPVTVYDVAMRLAAYLHIEPQSLYLHAGVRVGYALLIGRRAPGLIRIPKEQLPKALQRIPCNEVEDMLCAYREYMKPSLLR